MRIKICAWSKNSRQRIGQFQTLLGILKLEVNLKYLERDYSLRTRLIKTVDSLTFILSYEMGRKFERPCIPSTPFELSLFAFGLVRVLFTENTLYTLKPCLLFYCNLFIRSFWKSLSWSPLTYRRRCNLIHSLLFMPFLFCHLQRWGWNPTLRSGS